MPITTAGGVADSAALTLETANTTLAAAISNLQSIFSEIHTFNTGLVAVPAKPTVSRSISLTALTTQLTAIQAALDDVTLGANSIVVPTYASTETPIWDEVYWDSLKTTLTNIIGSVTTSTNVDDLITHLTGDATHPVAAIYAADRERKQQGLRDSFSAASASTGAKGFTYPNSMTTALKLSAQQQYMFELAQTSRDLIKQIFEWAKTSYQFAIDKQITVHAADVEFNLQYRRMAEAAFAAEAQRLLLAYQIAMAERMKLVEQSLAAYRIALDAAKLDAELGVKEIELQLHAYAQAVQENITQTQLGISTSFTYYNNRLSAANSAVNAAAGAVASSGQIAMGIFNG